MLSGNKVERNTWGRLKFPKMDPTRGRVHGPYPQNLVIVSTNKHNRSDYDF